MSKKTGVFMLTTTSQRKNKVFVPSPMVMPQNDYSLPLSDVRFFFCPRSFQNS